MGAQLKEVRIRIKSVMSTQQITKAMKMVSAAKLRKAQERIVQMRPYSNKLSEMLQNIVSGETDVNIEYAKQRTAEKVLVVLITSDRGLCGGFNANLIKTARNLILENYKDQNNKGNVEVMCIGKKGYDFFKRGGYKSNIEFINLFTNLSFTSAASAAEKIMNGFVAGTYDKVDIVYSQFKNAANQNYAVEPFLPIQKATPNKSVAKKANTDFIYQPSKEVLINELVPKILKTQFFKCLLDTNASEHGARMTAMDKASDNANELLKALRLSYNRARQAAITTELTEIVSGAAALEG